MGIDNIRHPIKDTIKADNSTYSSNKIESLIHSATELPETSIEDAGDVLMVNDEGEWAKGEIIIPQELPAVSTDDNNTILSVRSGSWAKGPIIPYPTVSGKILKSQNGGYYLGNPPAEINAKTLSLTRSTNTLTLSDPDELSSCITALSSGGIVTIKDASGVWSISGYASNSIDIFRIVPEDSSHISIECATLNATTNTITSYTIATS